MADINIPPEAVEAAVAAANADDPYYVSRSQITAAIRAALENWPGMRVVLNGLHPPRVTLPLPQENSDDQ